MNMLQRLKPKSIAGRLAIGLAALVLLAVLAAAASTGFVLSRYIRGQINERLDVQIAAIATALNNRTPGFALAVADGPPFDRPMAGWYWKAELNGETFKSPSLRNGDIGAVQSVAKGHGSKGPQWADAEGPRGELLWLRVEVVPVGGEWAAVSAAAPAAAFFRPLRDAVVPVALSVLALGALLTGASILQVTLGLKPLSVLRSDLAKVRGGKADRLEGEQPSELQPLAQEINTLIEQNAEGLRRARAHVSNLGHALNTPLAALLVSLRPGAKDAERRRLVEEMQARIRHHLGRARAAALHGQTYAATELDPRIDDLLNAFDKVYAERALKAHADIAAGLNLACEPQDVDEILGNLLDNAFKWARNSVTIKARLDGGSVTIWVDDDGPGVDEDRLAEILRSGRRLDEAMPGHGFGLAISRELTELYGGAFELGRSSFGGLGVIVRLPVR